MIEDTAANGNLNFQDVVQALGETDPNSTNAAKLRQALGRGGLTTIQKHLDKIRADRAAALLPVDDVKAPSMPDSVSAMWGAAYGTAMAMVRTRMDAVVQERDALTTRLAAANQDREAWEAEVIGTAGQLAEVEAKLTAAAAAVRAQVTSAASEMAAIQQKLLEVVAQHEQYKASSETAALIAARDRELERLTMQSTLDRLMTQLTDSKSLLHKQIST